MAKEMLFSVVCPTCEAKIGVHDKRLVDQLVQCPKCGSIVQLSPSEADAKKLNSTQPTEEKKSEGKPETNTLPNSELISQPIVHKQVESEKPSSNHTAPPVSPVRAVPVPPPAAIPVPPSVSIPEPMSSTDLVPEPMSPGTFNSNSSLGNKRLAQQLSSLSDKFLFWTPYLVIGIGVMVLFALLALFLFSGSKQKIYNRPTVENTENNIIKEEGKTEENNNTKPNTKNSKNINNVSDVKNVSADNTGKSSSDDNSLQIEFDENIEQNNENNEQNSEIAENTALDNDNAVQPDNNSEQKTEEHSAPIKTDEDINNSVVEENSAADEKTNTAQENISIWENNSDADASSPQSELTSIPGLAVKLKSIAIRELKLSQCLQTIRELGALPIEVNWDSLRRNGVNADDKISWSGKDVTLKTVLTEVLAQRGLMYKINNERKIYFVPRVSVNARSNSDVKSNECSPSAMVKAQYSVSDLVGRSPEKTTDLIRSIREFLCPGDWKEFGGAGTIASAGGGSVVITQSQQNQWIIADFLDRLRLARHLAPLYNRDVSLDSMSIRAQSALKRNIGINFQPTADLKTALSEIGQRISVNILLDEPSLKIAGISAQFPISFDAREMTLEETFHRIKEETGLTYMAQTPNSFIVTTPEGVKSMMSVEFYPIADLVDIGLTPTVLMEQIVKFEPKSWKSQDAASFGLIDYDSNSDCLIVRQSSAVLSKISELLTQLRTRLKEKE